MNVISNRSLKKIFTLFKTSGTVYNADMLDNYHGSYNFDTICTYVMRGLKGDIKVRNIECIPNEVTDISSAYAAAGLVVRETADQQDKAPRNPLSYPRIGLYWANIAAGSICLNEYGEFCFFDTSGVNRAKILCIASTAEYDTSGNHIATKFSELVSAINQINEKLSRNNIQ